MMLSEWSSNWPMTLLAMAVSLGGLAFLIGLALFSEFAADTPQPVDREATDAREVLKLRLMRGDIDATEYLDRVNALSKAHHA
jgi:uncharacterized membrane protein